MPAPGAQHQSVANPFDERGPRISEYTAEEIALLQHRLEQKLGPEYISARPGPSGTPVHYIGAEKVISLANDVFGFNGWSSSIQNIQVDYVDENQQTNRITLGISVVVRVTLRDGTYHEDIGYGKIENAKGKGAAFEKAKKEATTDAMKRALRHFGNVLGNCIYDKDYVRKVIKIKPGPGREWDIGDLHRHADFKGNGVSVMPMTTMQRPTSMTMTSAPSMPSPVGGPTAQAIQAKRESTTAPSGVEMTEEVADALFDDDEYDGAFDPSDFAPDEEGHPDEVSITANAPAQVQPAKLPVGNSISKPNPPPANNFSRAPQTPIQNQSYPRPQPQAVASSFGRQNVHIAPKPPTNPPARAAPPTRASGPPNGAPYGAPQNAGPPNGTVGFFSAKSVTVDSKAADVNVSGGRVFDPKSESPSIRKTAGIDHNSSKPVSRGGMHVPPSSQQSTGPGNGPNSANTSTGNSLNPHVRRIGAPGGPGSPLANRGQYKPPTMKRPLGEGAGTAGAPEIDAGRAALTEVSTNGPGAGGGGGLDPKRQKMA